MTPDIRCDTMMTYVQRGLGGDWTATGSIPRIWDGQIVYWDGTPEDIHAPWLEDLVWIFETLTGSWHEP